MHECQPGHVEVDQVRVVLHRLAYGIWAFQIPELPWAP